jgi:hypothetical protein
LADWPALEELVLECNEFYDSPLISRIMDTKGLKFLSVQSKSKTGTLLLHIAKLENLEALRLSFELDEQDLVGVLALPKLTVLDLSGCNITDASLRHLLKSSSLKKVILKDTMISAAGFDAFRNAANAKGMTVER